MSKNVILLLLLLAVCIPLHADEGMWMVNSISDALEKKMQERGLRLSAGEIYNADAEGASLADAVVSLDFGCTGSMISSQGLLITNHHCAYSDIHSLSTPEHNLLEDGFWAMTSSEERNIPGKKAWFLKKVVDVTGEAEAMLAEAEAAGHRLGSRKLAWSLEKKYRDITGYEASLGTMWSGKKYYMALYEVYRDVRLVAAPPVSLAAFGGDIDNWEWPQHKCDFALYRVYAAPDGTPADYSPENVPMQPAAVLDISLDGYAPGDFTMVIGYPGRTDRYSSSYKTAFETGVTLPVSNAIRERQMALIRKWMDACPDIRLKYSDYYFSLSNIQENDEGKVYCCRRFDVAGEKVAAEDSLQEWIASSAGRQSRWGGLLGGLSRTYRDVSQIEKALTVYRETVVRGTRLARATYRLGLLKNQVLESCGIAPRRAIDSIPPSDKELSCCAEYRFRGKDYTSVMGFLLKDYEGLDLRVERDLFRYAVEEFYASFDSVSWGPYQKELYRKYLGTQASLPDTQASLSGTQSSLPDTAVSSKEVPEVRSRGLDALCSAIWDSSFLTDTARLDAFVSERHTVDEYLADPLYRFIQDIRIADLNRLSAGKEGRPGLSALSKEYVHALYSMRLEKGEEQYPDANSTMRITYGTVGSLVPRDGVTCLWRSTAAGILEKYDPTRYEYRLDSRQKHLFEDGDWGRWSCLYDGSAFLPADNVSRGTSVSDAGCLAAIPGAAAPASRMYVNFLTDNDITGGNSGSPVLNADGKLIGLAFDGNKESLASDFSYTPGYNKCVCVDIRYVLWTLDRYAGMTRIISELGL